VITISPIITAHDFRTPMILVNATFTVSCPGCLDQLCLSRSPHT
jgi:hypothetical protein